MHRVKSGLAAAAVVILTASGALAQNFSAALIQGRSLDAEATEQIEASLKVEPHDDDARARLLGYYSARAAQDPAARSARLAQIEWLIGNEPDSPLLRHNIVRLQVTDFAASRGAGLETLRRAWREQVDRHPDDPVAIENAVRSLGFVETVTSAGERILDYLRRLRMLEPGDPEWVVALAGGYASAVARGMAPRASAEAVQSAARIRAELTQSDDAALVGTTGGIVYDGARLAPGGPVAAQMRVFGESLLRRASDLNSKNQGWAGLISAPAPSNSIQVQANVVATLRESDLWPGGHEVAVPPGAIRLPPETEKARRPKLDFSELPSIPLGECNLRFNARIGREGRIQELQLTAFNRLTLTSIVFVSYSVDALRDARYPPAVSGGHPVEAVTQIDLSCAKGVPPPANQLSGVPGGLVGGVLGGMAAPPPPPPPLPRPARPVSPPPVLVSASVSQSRLVTRVPPEYPALARADGVQGVVRLKVILNKDGRVTGITLISGPPLLTSAAIAAVKKWVYEPTLVNGEPVSVQTQVDVNFTLQQ